MWVSTLLTVWKLSSIAPGLMPEQWLTQNILFQVNYAIAEYEKEHGEKADSLSQLQEYGYVETNDDGQLLDDWGNPMAIHFDGTNLAITSFGRDGKPGGIGLDHDLSSLDPTPDGTCMTLYQFLFDAPSTNLQLLCFGIGIFTCIAIISDKNSKKKPGRWQYAFTFSVLILAIFFFTVFISTLQLYSGH